MQNVVFVTGNKKKAQYFAKMVGLPIENIACELDEIQSLSLREIVEHKARQAFEVLERPVLVEDTKLSCGALGALPGPFIKWYLEELGLKGICKMLENFEDRSAVAGAAIAYYDGSILEIFEKELSGTISTLPRGNAGFGWNPIFIPTGADKTLGEMNDTEFELWYKKIKPFFDVGQFIKKRSAKDKTLLDYTKLK